ncbi:MAG: hypothetical protein WBA25_10950 [Jannaschia sp.]
MTAVGKKITVSYGTFSCTLEGYDDPMPALAEVVAYFRGIEAEDRRFGTAPAEVEEEMPRRIGETRMPDPDESGTPTTLVLRAVEEVLPEPVVATQDGASEADPEGREPDLAEATPRSDGKDKEEITRLFAATDDRLTGEDTFRRQASLRHAKAAVALRRAEDPKIPHDADTTGDYRADLARTMRHPGDGTGRTIPAPERAPLILGSEQRVAVGTSGSAAFAQFARDRDAVDLPLTLEAAAAFHVEILERDSFTRPDILRLAGGRLPGLKREDGLRAFGRLLRDGTLRRVDTGTFALGPNARSADGDRSS